MLMLQICKVNLILLQQQFISDNGGSSVDPRLIRGLWPAVPGSSVHDTPVHVNRNLMRHRAVRAAVGKNSDDTETLSVIRLHTRQ